VSVLSVYEDKRNQRRKAEASPQSVPGPDVGHVHTVTGRSRLFGMWRLTVYLVRIDFEWVLRMSYMKQGATSPVTGKRVKGTRA
jgi:hypothetical protein